MALNDKTQRVLVKVDADTDGAQKEMRGLQREVNATTKSIVDGFKNALDSVGAMDGSFEKLKRGMENIGGIAEKGIGVLRDVAKHARLEVAAAGVDIEKLAKATKGLAGDSQLLADAARLNHGAFKLQADAMATVEAAMQGLIARGFETQKVHESVLQAVTALKDDGLKDLGIFIDKTGLSMDKESDRGEVLKRVLAELTKVSREFGSAQLTAADQAEKAAVSIENSLDKAKRKLEELAVHGATGIGIGGGKFSKAFLQSVGVDAWTDGSLAADVTKQIEAAQVSRRRILALLDKDYKTLAELGVRIPVAPGTTGASYKTTRLDKQEGPTVISTPAGDYDAKAAAEKWMEVWRATVKSEQTPDAFGDLGFSRPGSSVLGALAGGGDSLVGNPAITKLLEDINKGRELTNAWNAEIAKLTEHQKLATEIIGVVDATQLAAQGFQSMADAAGEAWTQALTGAQSFGSAFKKAAGQAIIGESKSMFVSGIKEEALALASLALGPLGGHGAAFHAAAGAALIAGSAVAGKIGAELGGGGGSTPGKPSSSGYGGGGVGSASPAPYSSGTGSSGPVRQQIIIVGDNMDLNSSPRAKQQQLREQVERVMASRGGEY